MFLFLLLPDFDCKILPFVVLVLIAAVAEVVAVLRLTMLEAN